MKYLFVLLILSICLSSCQQTESPLNSTPQYFPDKVGDSWTYRYEYGKNNTQMIEVRIVGESKLPDGTDAKLWKYSYPNYTDTLWVTYNGMVAKFYYKPCFRCSHEMRSPKLRYIFPLKAGNSWHTDVSYGDTTKVLIQQTVSVPAGTFQTYKISKSVGYVTNSWTQDTLWFKPEVGLIKKSQYEYSLGPLPGNGSWELSSYKVQ